MSAEDDQIPEMPADFASAPAASQWERIQRTTRKAARLEADVGTLRAQLAEATAARQGLAPLEAQLAEATTARQAAEARAEALGLRIPLLREGIEDDEVADLVVERWRRSQASVEADKRKAIHEWIRSDGASDKIIAPHLLGARKVDPTPKPPVGNPNVGTTTVVASTGTVIDDATYSARIRALAPLGNAAYDDPQIKAYMAAHGISAPKPRK